MCLSVRLVVVIVTMTFTQSSNIHKIEFYSRNNLMIRLGCSFSKNIQLEKSFCLYFYIFLKLLIKHKIQNYQALEQKFFEKI